MAMFFLFVSALLVSGLLVWLLNPWVIDENLSRTFSRVVDGSLRSHGVSHVTLKFTRLSGSKVSVSIACFGKIAMAKTVEFDAVIGRSFGCAVYVDRLNVKVIRPYSVSAKGYIGRVEFEELIGDALMYLVGLLNGDARSVEVRNLMENRDSWRHFNFI